MWKISSLSGGYTFAIGDVIEVGNSEIKYQLEVAKKKAAEAANEIEKLNNEIEKLNKKIEEAKPKITIDMIVPGAQFMYDHPTNFNKRIIITLIKNCNDYLWYISGARDSVFQIYLCKGRTTDEMFEYLVNDHLFVKYLENKQ